MSNLPLEEWTDWAKRDDWHALFVGSDIRQMLGEIGRLRVALERKDAALKPLAEAADAFDWVTKKGQPPDGVFLWAESSNIPGQTARQISVSDAYRAREALTAGKQS